MAGASGTVRFDDGPIVQALTRLALAAREPAALLAVLGMTITEQTRRRFQAQEAPDGSPFYVGCLNLAERLEAKGEPICFPRMTAGGTRVHAFEGLYDVSLSLNFPGPVVGNEVDAAGRSLLLVTGANQGGKSTFLRSIGLAQMMMQAGMFVPARAFAANLCTRLHTHYKREEDASMTSGKFDEELARMSALIDRLHPDDLVLFNESFQSTNEREGSAIAREIVLTLLEHRVKVVFVTHLHDFARGLHERGDPAMVFLRAERRADGTRSFRVVEGKPLPTSFGEDLYRQIFGAEPHAPNLVAAEAAASSGPAHGTHGPCR